MQSYAIVPAAGKSVRMGQPKLLMPWRDATVIEAVLQAWQASSVSGVVVVVRPDDSQLAEVCRSAGAAVVQPKAAPPEMKDSVRLGLEFVAGNYSPQRTDAWLLAPADMPQLLPRVVDQLLQLHDEKEPSILVPSSKGKRGHPVLFPWPLAEQVNRLGHKEGVRTLLDSNPVREVVCASASILGDLDTPEDYHRLTDRFDHESSETTP